MGYRPSRSPAIVARISVRRLAKACEASALDRSGGQAGEEFLL